MTIQESTLQKTMEPQAPAAPAPLVEATRLDDIDPLDNGDVVVAEEEPHSWIVPITLVLMVIGLAVGVGVGLSLNKQGNTDYIVVNATSTPPAAIRKQDMDGYTVKAVDCFESTQELYRVVDDYVNLRARVKELSTRDYLKTRNETLQARDAIADTYGWPIGQFCVSKLTSLSEVFSTVRGGSAFLSFDEDLSAWDTGSVQNMNGVFHTCTSFNHPLATWNTSQVTSMISTFGETSYFDQNISTWNVSKVRKMDSLFSNADAFNQPIGIWDTGNVESMEMMFQDALLFDEDIGDWDVGRVTSMSYMFSEARTFNQDLSKWNMSSVTSVFGMFSGARLFNQSSMCEWGVSILGDDFERGFDAIRMFEGTSCSANATVLLRSEKWPQRSLCGDCVTYFLEKMKAAKANDEHMALSASTPVASHADLMEAVSAYLAFRFNLRAHHAYDSSTKSKLSTRYGWPIGNWNVSLIDDFSGIFSGYRDTVNALFNEDISSWDVSNGHSFASTFAGASLFDQDLSLWDVSKATSMSLMFGTNNSSLPRGGAARFNRDVSIWNVSKVRDMYGMFYRATAFGQDLNQWDTARVTTTSWMFSETDSFTSDLPWDISRVRAMEGMFAYSNFNNDISSWDVSRVRSFASMFMGSSFNVDISRWNVSSATSMAFMFCSTNFLHDISGWEPKSCYDFRQMFVFSSWNHSLCDWGRFLTKRGVIASGMFRVSECQLTEDPDITTIPVSPMCTVCPGA